MSRIAIYSEQGDVIEDGITDHKAISTRLQPLGVRFERWKANHPLTRDTSQEEVLAAYDGYVQRLTDEYGFKSVDVVSLYPDNPKRDEIRSKFLAEHVHNDFEVRLFVEGSGLFYLHVGDKVYLVLCEQDDLISVPSNITHWFDMGRHPHPYFRCIELFVIPDGWVAKFTDSDIAKYFPDFDQFVSNI